MPVRAPLTIVYPQDGNVFYADLARRLHRASAECASWPVALRSSAELAAQPAAALERQVLAVVNPYECTLTGPQVAVAMCRAAGRIAVLSEAVGTEWYRRQFTLSVPFEAVLDVGFVSQAGQHAIRGVPYQFLFNAPTAEERAALGRRSATPRPLPWTLVGHRTPARIELAVALARQVDPRGGVFLPNLRPVQPGAGLMSPESLHALLAQTRYYVWCAHHDEPYYESFRFLDAVRAGAVPCKIGRASASAAASIPGIFESVEAARAFLLRDPASAYAAACAFLLAGGTLGARFHDACERLSCLAPV